MKRRADWRKPLLGMAAGLFAAAGLIAQAAPEAAFQAKRQRAAELFAQGKRLEALPLLEELVRAEPDDDAMLVALAASLVEHAATLPDQEAAGKERLRARDLLDSAWQLGNTTPLAMNLSQLLHQLPAAGTIKFADAPPVDQALRAGEAAFSRRDFTQALRDYAKALELDPTNYSAALLTGNTYDKQNEFAPAAQWYERAIQLGPDVETAYRYYADMLAREGDMKSARTMLIRAAVAEPYNRIVWRELHAWASINHTRINEVYIGIPAERRDKQTPEVPGASEAWQAYREVRAKWQSAGEFNKHFPGEKEYRHSLREEFAALTAAAEVADPVTTDRSLGLLLKLNRAGLIEPYVLFSLGDAGIARDYVAYRSRNRNKLEEYLDRFVVPAID